MRRCDLALLDCVVNAFQPTFTSIMNKRAVSAIADRVHIGIIGARIPVDQNAVLAGNASVRSELGSLDRVVRLVDGAEYKRRQTPLVLRTSRKAFGSGRRLPIVHRYES